MKMRTVEITVGAFMLAGILSLLVLALQVSGLSNFYPETAGYKIKAEFSNIGALKVRAKVSIAGVVVGRVIGIELDPKSFNATVIMKIDPRSMKDKLPADTRASIMTAGLLGDNYIALSPGFSETEFLQEGSVISSNNTDPAIVLEQLISKFVANQANPSGSNPPQNVSAPDPVHVPNPQINAAPSTLPSPGSLNGSNYTPAETQSQNENATSQILPEFNP